MRTVHRSAVVPYTAAQMFDLVDDVAAYPEFLPWCHGASVARLDEDTQEASLEIGFSGLQKRFKTRNRASRPHRIDINLVEGPFRSLAGYWGFEETAEQGCRIELMLRFEVAGPLSLIFSTVFEEIARTQVNAFIARARQVYGH
jgi:ribosome-associated toxin RatA of RatAB toxin-antitoxin module